MKDNIHFVLPAELPAKVLQKLDVYAGAFGVRTLAVLPLLTYATSVRVVATLATAHNLVVQNLIGYNLHDADTQELVGHAFGTSRPCSVGPNYMMVIPGGVKKSNEAKLETVLRGDVYQVQVTIPDQSVLLYTLSFSAAFDTHVSNTMV